MTKRTLFIIISILAILDALSAFWYVVERADVQGGLEKITTVADSTVTAADTIATGARAADDSFNRIVSDTRFLSTMTDENGNQHVSVKHLRLRWPISIDGNASLVDLHAALLQSMFGKRYASLDDAVNKEMGTPSFNEDVGNNFTKVTDPKLINIRQGTANIATYYAYPVFTSHNLLEMKTLVVVYNGQSTSSRVGYVAYDRRRQAVLQIGDVIGDSEKAIAAINQKIERFNSKGANISNVNVLPTGFKISEGGITFDFPEGSIAMPKDGDVEIFLDWKSLDGSLTSKFAQLLKSNRQYVHYAPFDKEFKK